MAAWCGPYGLCLSLVMLFFTVIDIMSLPAILFQLFTATEVLQIQILYISVNVL